jgi:ribonuclease-3
MLGFPIRNPSIFQQALVHRSFCNENGLDAADSYERLEFLGDAVLELIVSGELYRQLPEASEGRLTKTRSTLVRGETLARVARSLDLGDLLLVGRGVEASGGRYQDSVLAAAFEALVAAVYLDRGMEQARGFVLRVMSEELAGALQRLAPQENPKSRLQEIVQGRGIPTPKYRLIASEGPDHEPLFTVEVLVGGQVAGSGQGGKKAEAEREAARSALLNEMSAG